MKGIKSKTFTGEQRKRICAARARGATLAELAAEYDCSTAPIRNALRMQERVDARETEPVAMESLRMPIVTKPLRVAPPVPAQVQNAPFDKSFRFRTSAQDRQLFRMAAAIRGKGESMQGVIRTLARDAALRIGAAHG